MSIASSLKYEGFFWGHSISSALKFKPLLQASPDVLYGALQGWAWKAFRIAESTVGASLDIRGLENIPAGACIYVGRHESEADTLVGYQFMSPKYDQRRVVYVMKEELLRIPLYGEYAKYVGMIPHKRTAGEIETKKMVADIEAAINRGISVYFFPEATRKEVGQLGDLTPILLLYQMYRKGIPVVCVNTNSGRCWPRARLGKKKGTIIYEIEKPLVVGLNRAKFLAHFQETLVSEPGSGFKRTPTVRKRKVN